MVIDVAVRGADEVKLLCSWCKVVVMYEVVVSYVSNLENHEKWHLTYLHMYLGFFFQMSDVCVSVCVCCYSFFFIFKNVLNAIFECPHTLGGYEASIFKIYIRYVYIHIDFCSVKKNAGILKLHRWKISYHVGASQNSLSKNFNRKSSNVLTSSLNVPHSLGGYEASVFLKIYKSVKTTKHLFLKYIQECENYEASVFFFFEIY